MQFTCWQKLTNAAKYLNRDTAQVLNPRTKFPKELSRIYQGSWISQKIASARSAYKNRKLFCQTTRKEKKRIRYWSQCQMNHCLEIFCETVKAPSTNKTLKNESIIIVKMKRMILIEVKLVNN